MSASLETLDRCHDVGAPQALTYYSSTLPCSSPRRDTALRHTKPKAAVDNTSEFGEHIKLFTCTPKTQHKSFN